MRFKVEDNGIRGYGLVQLLEPGGKMASAPGHGDVLVTEDELVEVKLRLDNLVEAALSGRRAEVQKLLEAERATWPRTT